MKGFRTFFEATENNLNELFNKLFSVRQAAHELHLKSKSHAEHQALDSFYTKLLELTDELIEAYQGQYDLAVISPKKSEAESAKSLLEDFGKFLDNHRPKDSHLANIVDEIKAITYRTLYKIRFLK